MATQYFCKKEQRRAQVLSAVDSHGNPFLNGIDFLEVDTVSQKILHVHFLFDLPGTPNPVPLSPAPALSTDNIVINGGVRITGIVPTSATAANNVLTVNVNAAGDFSTYTLSLITSAKDPTPPAGFDPQLSAVDFSFKVTCPSDFDCQQSHVCATPESPTLNINYLAKDYASFRQLILDRMAVTMPNWTERTPADIGIALVELLAYAGDQLSYYQDAVATEAYLGTARRRVSVRRHARLLDYPMHDGCNARAWVFFQVDPGPAVLTPKGTTLLTQGTAPRGPLLQKKMQDALNQGSLVFQTLADITAHPELNSLNFYTWSDDQCCLPLGATEATLVETTGGALPVVGDLLLFEEVLGAATGLPEDADPAHRHVVRLTSVIHGQDPLNNQKVIEITWDPADALPFPLCLSTLISGAGGTHSFPNVSVARGNIVLADHGMTQPAETLPDVVDSAGPYRPKLQHPGLTVTMTYDDLQARTQPAAGVLLQDPQQALPDIVLERSGTWTPRRDLLSSDRTALDFVAELEQDGSATLRFGDGILGAKPVSGLQATYRTGSGSSGNVGAESIAYVVITPTTPLPGISNVRNPLPAQGGVDPESLDQVRAFAPSAFRTQERAVTVADYATVAQRHPEVQRAQATLRWTGSWYTMFVTLERAGGKPVDATFQTQIRIFLEQFRLAGYDLEIEAPKFVSLDIAFTVCVASGYFRSAVQSALLDTFSNRVLPDGSKGFFHPDNFTFGQPVYISQIVAAAMRVAGAKWVDTNDIPPAPNHFTRWGQPPHREVAAGQVAMATLEIARLDNDPSRPENGRIRFFLEGGL
jgi:hypothetical protein